MAVERVGVCLQGKEAALNVGQPVTGKRLKMREIVGSEKAARRVGVLARLSDLIEAGTVTALLWPR